MRTKTQQNRFIGKRLRRIRQSYGVNQKVLAEKIKISAQQIQKYENGTNSISLYSLFKIAEALNVPVTDFIEDENEQLVTPQEERALYYWRSLQSQDLQDGFVDIMRCVSNAQSSLREGGEQ